MLSPTTAYVIVVIFVATLIRSTLGFGEALIAVPLLAVRLPITIAAPLAVLISILIAGVVVVQDWQHVQLRSVVTSHPAEGSNFEIREDLRQSGSECPQLTGVVRRAARSAG